MGHGVWFAKGHNRTYAPSKQHPYSITSSAVTCIIDGTVNAERLGGLEVDDELEFGGVHDRQVGRFLALENPSGVDAGLAIGIGHGWLP